MVQSDRWRAEFHAHPGRPQRHDHGLRLCADRRAIAWPVLDHSAMGDAVAFRSPLHCRAGGRGAAVRRSLLARGGEAALAQALRTLQPISLIALLATLV